MVADEVHEMRSKMAGRPPFSFVLIDLPSDHEVDQGLSTECEVIRAILSNRGFHSITKTARISSVERFRTEPLRPYPNVGYVHLATHGWKSGISLIGRQTSWSEVAKKLKCVAPRLPADVQRVLTLSCCFSALGYRALKPRLRGHFTGCYYFSSNKIGFSDAITVWAMFYMRKTIKRPHAAIVERINKFLDEDILCFGSI
jgi:hypothetical protein